MPDSRVHYSGLIDSRRLRLELSPATLSCAWLSRPPSDPDAFVAELDREHGDHRGRGGRGRGGEAEPEPSEIPQAKRCGFEVEDILRQEFHLRGLRRRRPAPPALLTRWLVGKR